MWSGGDTMLSLFRWLARHGHRSAIAAAPGGYRVRSGHCEGKSALSRTRTAAVPGIFAIPKHRLGTFAANRPIRLEPHGRIWCLLIAEGYGLYLLLDFNGGHYVVFYYVFVLPILMIVGSRTGSCFTPLATPRAGRSCAGPGCTHNPPRTHKGLTLARPGWFNGSMRGAVR
jgi:hypothetical protein